MQGTNKYFFLCVECDSRVSLSRKQAGIYEKLKHKFIKLKSNRIKIFIQSLPVTDCDY
jgi:hypothetical protein